MMDDMSNQEHLGVPASHTIELPAAKGRLWEVISDPSSLADYHPFCERNEVERWPGPGSHDWIYYYSGVVFERHFVGWMDGVGFDIDGSTDDGTRYRVSWRIEETGSEASTLTITIWLVVPPGVEDRSRQMSRLLTRYLKQVGKGLQHYIRTGEPVSRNQFGAHRLFSPQVTE